MHLFEKTYCNRINPQGKLDVMAGPCIMKSIYQHWIIIQKEQWVISVFFVFELIGSL